MGNYINPKYTSKRQVLMLVGKHLVESAVRKDPVTCAEKEKEGVFNFEEEMNKIEAQIQQTQGPTVEQQQKAAQQQIKADKKKQKKRR